MSYSVSLCLPPSSFCSFVVVMLEGAAASSSYRDNAEREKAGGGVSKLPFKPL